MANHFFSNFYNLKCSYNNVANCAFFLLFFFRTMSLHCLAPPPPNSKIAISQKLSPLTYPENSWLFQKWNKEASVRKSSYLTVWGLPKSQGIALQNCTTSLTECPKLKTLFEEKNSHFNQGCQYFFFTKCSSFYKIVISLNLFILLDAEINQGFSFGNRPSFLRVSRQTVYLCIEVTHRSHLPDPPACIRAW